VSGEPRRPRRRRDLTPEERTLWAKVAESIRPLSKRIPPPPEEDEIPVKKAPPPPRPKPRLKPAAEPIKAPPPAPKSPPLASLEPKLARNLRRGGAVDARLDLHGFRQEEAHDRLIRFVRSQQARGARVVLVITGKGKRDSESALFEERGVLRRLVPAWLSEPALREVVIGFSEASGAHGGAGALYVRLRRER
jgi:DNA-nicking Smr family endonuclease